MVTATPGRPRASVETVPGGLRISAPAPRSWGVLLFLPPWLVGWALGELAALRELTGAAATSGSAGPILFLTVWLLAWTAGGLLVAFTFLWTAFGRETVELADATLSVRRHVLGLGRTRRYDAARVQGLRVWAGPAPGPRTAPRLRRPGLGGGTIAFDHGGRTVRVLGGLDEAEATALVAQLGARLGSTRTFARGS
jgi:hypothetical protein